jgi:hypothetical protein
MDRGYDHSKHCTDNGFVLLLYSVGSLGKYPSLNGVTNVTVKGVSFTGTDNGVRIKTWQGGKGFAKGLTFENIRMDNVRNPIIIDQYYCPGCTAQVLIILFLSEQLPFIFLPYFFIRKIYILALED